MSDAWCKKYIKVPFLDKGRDWAGCDCWGLYYLIMKNEHGIEVPSYNEYDSTDLKHMDEIAELISRYCTEHWDLKWERQYRDDRVNGRTLKPFDILVLVLRSRPWHVGIVIDHSRFIHITEGINATIERYDSNDWKHKIESVHRHRTHLEA